MAGVLDTKDSPVKAVDATTPKERSKKKRTIVRVFVRSSVLRVPNRSYNRAVTDGSTHQRRAAGPTVMRG